MTLLAGKLSYLGSGLLSFKFAGLASGFEFLIAVGENGSLTVGEAIGGSDVANRAVQAGGIIVLDELADDAFGVGEIERGFGADGLFFEGAVEALQLAVAPGAGADRGQSTYLDKFFVIRRELVAAFTVHVGDGREAASLAQSHLRLPQRQLSEHLHRR